MSPFTDLFFSMLPLIVVGVVGALLFAVASVERKERKTDWLRVARYAKIVGAALVGVMLLWFALVY